MLSKKPVLTPEMPAPERLSGSVERVTFHSEETGFCVLRVKVRGQRESGHGGGFWCGSDTWRIP